jgi:hypothetical protein
MLAEAEAAEAAEAQGRENAAEDSETAAVGADADARPWCSPWEKEAAPWQVALAAMHRELPLPEEHRNSRHQHGEIR